MRNVHHIVGVAALSATAIISVRIVESTSLSRPGDDKEIHIFEPPVDFILNLDEVSTVNWIVVINGDR